MEYPATLVESIELDAPTVVAAIALVPAIALSGPTLDQLSPTAVPQSLPAVVTPVLAAPAPVVPVAPIAIAAPVNQAIGLTTSATERWYCVTKGRQVGALQGW